MRTFAYVEARKRKRSSETPSGRKRLGTYGLWFVLALFSLSPCTLKEALFAWADVTYDKPPNKARTLAQQTNCAYFTLDARCVSSQSEAPSGGSLTLASESSFRTPDEAPHPLPERYSLTSGNSPPKYILYKRLKIGNA